jgi:hypothetical protein
MNMTLAPRLILYHKQATSARTCFLRLADSLLAFTSLPTLSAVRAENAAKSSVVVHPAPVLRNAEQRLGLVQGDLRAATEYYAEVDTVHGTVPVLLAEFTAIDPPFDAAESVGGRFIAITEARGLSPVELELLRRAYTVILG